MEWAAVITALTTMSRLLSGCYPTIKSFICLESNLRALEEEKNRLLVLIETLKKEVDYSSDATMTKWLEDAAKILYEEDSVKEHPKCCDNCLFCCCKRKSHSLEIARLVKEVKRLVKEGPIAAKMSNKDYLKKPVESLPGPSIDNDSSASIRLAQTISLLKGRYFKRIGVWGMGGVGKTTLVKSLNNKLKDTHIFEVVIMVTVSQRLDLEDVRRQIAERLNLEIKIEEREESLANRIRRKLEKHKFLLFLDDVWEMIDLDSLGVPAPEDSALGSKIILTCRFLEVCREMMTDIEVKVDILNDKESWKLFTKTAGSVATSEQIRPIARAVAKECGGLPLAIIAAGKAMRGQQGIRIWEDALSQLRSSKDIPDIPGMKKYVFNSLKLSYDSLQGDNNIKPCFLYRCLYPADFSIEVSELVKCWLGEGWLDGYRDYETIYNRGVTLIQNLKDSCLLEDGAREGTVKMHDMVRIVAIWISSSLEDGCKSLVQSGMGLTEIPESYLSTPHKRVALMHNKIANLPDLQVDCSMSCTLFLQDNHELRIINEEFLRAFQSLKVLNISGTCIRYLPESISQLVGLLVLIMRDCINLEDIPQVSILSELQVLDCSGSGITSLPSRMKRLRQLYLARTRRLRTIAPGIISAMSCLEVLDMASSIYTWDAPLDELIGLEHLLFISMQLSCFPNLGSKGKEWIRRLRRYQFVIGTCQTSFWQTQLDGKMVIITNECLQGVSSSGPLLSPETSLIMDRSADLYNSLQNMAVKKNGCFAALRSLTIANSSMLISYTSTSGSSKRTGVPKFDLLPKLEKLHLINVQGLNSISDLMNKLGVRLSSLREIEVTNCLHFEFLFRCRDNFRMERLEVIRVRFCSEMTKLIWLSTRVTEYQDAVVPNLRVLEVTSCKELHHVPLSALNPQVLQEIRSDDEFWWSLLDDSKDEKARFHHLFKPVNYDVEEEKMFPPPPCTALSPEDEQWLSSLPV